MLLKLMLTQAWAQPGLKGDYYNGTNFEQKVLTRVDPKLHFNWVGHSPAAGVDQSYYSVRWTGKLLAPASGQYTFYAKVDDGIRIWIGSRKVMDAWYLNDSHNFTGSIVLQAGQYYDLRVDYFNAMLGGVIELYWQRPDEKKPLFGLQSNPDKPITAQYFRQTAPPVMVRPRPKPPVTLAKRPVNAVGELPQQKPIAGTPPTPKPIIVKNPALDAVATLPKPISQPTRELTTGETFALDHVTFAQSSYVLLPESSAELDKLVQALLKNPHWCIGIAGHTDNVGDPRLNQSLSEYRARVVMNYLTRHGIAGGRVDATGYGSSRPLTGNATESERAQNRRVEFMVK